MTAPLPDIAQIDVLAPNFKRRLSGVTATVVRLVPLQAHEIAIAATGPVLPQHVPQVPLTALLTMPRRGPHGARVWHARRNVEMIGGLALKYLLGKRLKLVFTSASQRRQTWLTRWLIRRMDVLIATSERTAHYLERPARVIMHGIDLKGFSPTTDKTRLRSNLGLPTDGPLIGCYGRIRASKGTDVFVEAMIGALKDQPGHALVMGRATSRDTAFFQSIKDRATQAGMAERIHFLPEVPVHEIADWYRALDLYVAPQRWEGFGLTPIEAMACGVPVIATKVGAFEQIITPQTGALVEPGDIEALSSAIHHAIAVPDQIESWAQNCRAHVATHFDIAREASDLTALYQELLNSTV